MAAWCPTHGNRKQIGNQSQDSTTLDHLDSAICSDQFSQGNNSTYFTWEVLNK